MKVLIVGSDSYIAKAFIFEYSSLFKIRGISRKYVSDKNNTVLEDFFRINNSLFLGMDVVINFAAIVHNPKDVDVDLYHRINHQLALNVAHKAKEAKVRHFIQMSTIAVYGHQKLLCENTDVSPLSTYARTKLFADNDLISMMDKHFKVSIIRPPMVYGGYNTPGNMSQLIKICGSKLPLPLKFIDNRRDFIHIRNLIQYLEHIIRNGIYGIILVSDGDPISTSELVKKICCIFDLQPRLFKIPMFVRKVFKFTHPSIYNKLFESSIIDSNIGENACKNKFTLDHGLKEMLTSSKHHSHN